MGLFPLLFLMPLAVCAENIPMVINTWAFNYSTQAAWDFLKSGNNAVDSVERGCSVCEELQCDGTVGFGGSPDENGETTLDALIFDGTKMNMGAVGALRNIKPAISVAKHVLLHTTHSLLVGSQATEFALQMGFKKQSLTTEKSRKIQKKWLKNNCQPNSWLNVQPNSGESCGPYSPITENSVHYCFNKENCEESLEKSTEDIRQDVGQENHDTIGMVVIDSNGNIAAGTSTNGMTHKIPGRVGDSPIVGAGAYAKSSVGGASATGDGDVMMRFLPSFLAVNEMERGVSPQKAVEEAIAQIRQHYPTFFGGIVAVNKSGDYGAACNGMDRFKFTVASEETGGLAKVLSVACNDSK